MISKGGLVYVYSIKTKDNEEALVYVLIEARFTSDHWIALGYGNICHYCVSVIGKIMIDLPLIYPLLLYHGSESYNAPKKTYGIYSLC
ncbi:MAG: Rpn family recombination-promoting nuclease/putative transposase [Candidatus Midichloria sp.]|uniref:Transposase, YhgA-like n=1 Tax=Hyalomma marginatum TaxID=34627 RepID=A0A8S4C0E2_9ACAR|nr:Putative transposase, YhgA-like [Hyalomma marginatum]CAG7596493.1 Putative transposase, YhgA-like [Hyalomma marginatum]